MKCVNTNKIIRFNNISHSGLDYTPLKEMIHSLGGVLYSGFLLINRWQQWPGCLSPASGAEPAAALPGQRKDLATVVHAIVIIKKLQYLYVGWTLKIVQKLQLIPNAVVGRFTGEGHTDHITLVFFHIYWLPFCSFLPLKPCIAWA